MPTEEVFSTPHNQRTDGWVRTSRPCFPFERRVEDAYFRFEKGELVEFHATTGQDALEQFFQIRGARRLGEVSLVDVRSPIYQHGLIFYETLFDENAACHIAFGEAYPEGVENGAARSEGELANLGVNSADTHVDFMIGTPTMHVTGKRLDGSSVQMMQDGRFTREVLDEMP
jgi:aminopeptidase